MAHLKKIGHKCYWYCTACSVLWRLEL